MTLKNSELKALFQRGFIPGPFETEEEFKKRVQRRPPLHLPEWEKVAPYLQKQWGFSINWVPVIYSKKSLFIWEGAAFWSGGDEVPCVQIRPFLSQHELFTKQLLPILSHEAVHAARETFHEPFFEERLAYHFSSSSLEKWVSPLFQKIYELPIFALLIALFPLTPLISSFGLLFFVLRLSLRHLVFHLALKRASLPILLCLRDQEIFAISLPKYTLSFDGSLRHHMIKALSPSFFS
ncbi:hypothetical protein [Rhabdochlamydiaceae symbiont of Dictyostelium giganteum]|uniref:hypothetical protein n=1 Tax=Rhabdochlamydiaceae symbiont of Dictyostelium giganteum TaxID=3342349 RepID=UPI00384E6618